MRNLSRRVIGVRAQKGVCFSRDANKRLLLQGGVDQPGRHTDWRSQAAMFQQENSIFTTDGALGREL